MVDEVGWHRQKTLQALLEPRRHGGAEVGAAVTTPWQAQQSVWAGAGEHMHQAGRNRLGKALAG